MHYVTRLEMLFQTGSRGNQSERKVSSTKIELRATVTSDSSAVSVEIESVHQIQVFPNQRTMENHRFPIQSYGFDDDSTAAVDAHSTTHDERSGNEKRNGKFEHQQNDQRNARN